MAAQFDSPTSHPPHLNFTHRRRPITSCLECYRRKLKCSRVRPCNQCCARNVPEKCHFHGDRPSAARTPLANQPSANPASHHVQSDLEEASPIQLSLVNRAGFAATPGGSSFDQLGGVDFYGPSNFSSPSQDLARQRIRDRRDEYLRLVARLPPPDIVHALLDFSIRDVYWAIVAIDEHRLKIMYSEWCSKPPEEHIQGQHENGVPTIMQGELIHFPALLFQILAKILHHLSPQHPAATDLGLKEYTDCTRLSETYYLVGSRIITILGREYPTLCSVEADLTSCFWLKDSGRGAEAWHRLANAIRQAQELGLHRLGQSVRSGGRFSESEIAKLSDLEHGKKIWARLFSLDSVAAALLGRPRILHREDISTPTPSDWGLFGDISAGAPSTYNQCADAGGMLFLLLGHKIHDMLSSSATGKFIHDYTKVLVIHEDISTLREKSSFLLTPSDHHTTTTGATSTETLRCTFLRLNLLSTITSVLVALHRPFITTHTTSLSAATNAALEGLDLQHSIFDMIPHAQFALYAPAISTLEASVFLCGVVKDFPPQDPDEDRRIRRALLLAIGRLAATKDWSPLAEAAEQVLRNFYHQIQAARQQKHHMNMIDHGTAAAAAAAQDEWIQQDPLCVYGTQEQGQASYFDSNNDNARVGHISIPAPQQSAQEIYQSLFGGGQPVSVPPPLGFLQGSLSSTLGAAASEHATIQGDNFWPEFEDMC